MTAPNDKKYEQQHSESNPTPGQQKVENKMEGEDKASTCANGNDNVHEVSIQQDREAENQIDVPAHSENNDEAEHHDRSQAPQQARNNSRGDPLGNDFHYLVDAINCVIRSDAGLNCDTIQIVDFPVSDEIVAEVYGWRIEAEELIEESLN